MDSFPSLLSSTPPSPATPFVTRREKSPRFYRFDVNWRINERFCTFLRRLNVDWLEVGDDWLLLLLNLGEFVHHVVAVVNYLLLLSRWTDHRNEENRFIVLIMRNLLQNSFLTFRQPGIIRYHETLWFDFSIRLAMAKDTVISYLNIVSS